MPSRQGKRRQSALPVKELPVSRTAAVFAFLERRGGVVALLLVLLASARIVATYTVFNHTFDEPARCRD